MPEEFVLQLLKSSVGTELMQKLQSLGLTATQASNSINAVAHARANNESEIAPIVANAAGVPLLVAQHVVAVSLPRFETLNRGDFLDGLLS